jgi:alkylation response protein AidB-like acyl-CoA dehydrogenase
MDFDYSEFQSILLSSTKNFLEKEAKGLFREIENTEEGYSPQLWEKIAELGWLGVLFPAEYGGIDGSFMDMVLLIEEMGKALFPGPFIPTMISGLAILKYGQASQKEEILPRMIEGKLILSPCLEEPDDALNESIIEEKVSTRNGDYILSGTRLFAPYAHVSDRLIYSADRVQGKAIFLVDTKSPGVSCNPLDSIGGDKVCEVNFNAVEVPESSVLGETGKGEDIIAQMNEWGALAESAYLVGMLEQVLKMSLEHAKEREQFGKKIGSFQAIQHQCANMAMDIDQAKSLTHEAAWKLSENLPSTKEISMAKAWASDAARRVCLMGVKIHGGTGVSEEHDMQLYFRKAKASELAHGDGDRHREIVARQLGL